MNCTPEEAERHVRQMATLEGWTDIRRYDGEDRPCGCAGTNPPSDYGWGEDQECPLIGKPPDEDDSNWHLSDYPHDLNALQRVCVKICALGEAEAQVLRLCFDDAWFDKMTEEADKDMRVRELSEFMACLSAQELFPIIGKVTDQLKEKK